MLSSAADGMEMAVKRALPAAQNLPLENPRIMDIVQIDGPGYPSLLINHRGGGNFLLMEHGQRFGRQLTGVQGFTANRHHTRNTGLDILALVQPAPQIAVGKYPNQHACIVGHRH